MKIRQLHSRLFVRVGAVILAAVLMFPSQAHATGTLVLSVVGTTLQPNTSSNLVGIYVNYVGTGAPSENGMTLYIEIGDGGKWGNPNDGTQTGPVIDTSSGNTQSPYNTGTLQFKPTKNQLGVTTTAQLTSQTISGSPTNQPEDPLNGEDPTPAFSQEAETNVSFTAAKAFSATATLLEVISIDTTGYSSGSFVINFNGAQGASAFSDYGGAILGPGFTTTVNLTIAAATPEPASLGLLGVLLPALLLRRRRMAA